MSSPILFFSSFLLFVFINPSLAKNWFPLKGFPLKDQENLTTNILDKICQQTQDSNFCLRYLNNHTHINTTTIQQLAQTSLELAKNNANDIYREIKSSVDGKNEPELKEIFMICSEDYENAIDALGHAGGSLKSGNYPGLRVQASVALQEAKTCGNKLNYAPNDVAYLRQKNRNFLNQCGIIKAVVSFILQK
ncbi:Pectinesterase inhibitor [Melia azedarach]|uniref:Pectinesterase inhibitor n=1 Tax=Melia azedarach TaxID=155640 RepID=A0ACC1YA14_MELAZ|nr:Pectinesterase inhibitor [Melia azedarach]